MPLKLASIEADDMHAAEIGELRAALIRTQRALGKAKAKEEAVVEAVYSGAHDARIALGRPAVAVKAPAKDRRMKAEHVAHWCLGDWQGTKVTTSYNTAIMRQRLKLYVEKANGFTEEHRKARPIRRCLVTFGGDQLEGLWNYATQPWEVEYEPIEQVVIVADLMVEVVRAALTTHEHVDVVAEWGNHGRIGSKRDATPKSTNLDRMAYILASRELSADLAAGRLTFSITDEDIQRIEIGNYRALLIHGDEIGRTGYASTNTILAHVNKWKAGSYAWAFRDVYGHHYHTHGEWPLPDGAGTYFQTGSTESDNRYALVGMASSSQPSQRLGFIDPEKGVVVVPMKIWLDA